MSTPGVNPSLTDSRPTPEPAPLLWGWLMMIVASLGGFIGLLLHAAAAKLSYDKYQSPFWAVIDFIFGTVYIPYYAFVLNTPTSVPAMGGRRGRR